jgi:outer membrane immunogenic protein
LSWRPPLAAAALSAVCSVACAAPPVPIYNWSGFYIGGGGNINAETATWGFNWTRWAPPAANVGTSGGSLDFLAGYDFQVMRSGWGTTVIGIVGEYDVGSSSGRSDCLNGFFDCKTTASNFYSVRGRVGFAPNNGPALLYVTGGLVGETFVNQKFSSSPFIMRDDMLLRGVTSQRLGSTVGGGVQYMLFPPGTLSPALNGSISAYTQLAFIQFAGFTVGRTTINDNGVQWQFGLTYNLGDVGPRSLQLHY